MTKNNSKKEKLSFSYTYLAFAKTKNYLNLYKYNSAENEILEELKKIFQKYGNISNFDLIMSDKNQIKSLYQVKIGAVVDKTDFSLKTDLKSFLVKEHFSKLNISRFWSNFVFGFNAISRKLERGDKFHSLLIDSALKDAPILEYLRELANVNIGGERKDNSGMIMTMFNTGKLLDAVNTTGKRFSKVLMIGLLLSIDTGDCNGDLEGLKDMLASRMEPFANDCAANGDTEAITDVPELERTTQQEIPLVIEPMIEQYPIYVTDIDQVELLIAGHLRSTVTAACNPQIVDEHDYLSTLKRIKLDPPSQTTKFIQLPNKNQNKAKKKNRKK